MQFLLPLMAVLLVLALLTWSSMLARLIQMFIWRPRLRAPARHRVGAPPAVSIVVPAHNEAARIDRALHNLRAQSYEPLEIIIALDRCTDETADIVARHQAEDPRVRTITVRECPENWAGKCHAAQRGAESARGEWLLFTDVDTEFAKGLVFASVGWAVEHELGLLSLLSRLSSDRLFERIVQPIMGAVMGSLYPVALATGFPSAGLDARTDPPVNGQFMLFSATTYAAIGKHEAVQDALCEDLAFGRLVRARRIRHHVLLAEHWLGCRMYEDYASFLTGWQRILIEACERQPKALMRAAVIVALVGVVLPLVPVAAIPMGFALLHAGNATYGVAMLAAAAAAFGMQSLAAMGILHFNSAPLRWSPGLIFGSATAVRVLGQAATLLRAGSTVRWGGREYRLGPMSSRGES